MNDKLRWVFDHFVENFLGSFFRDRLERLENIADRVQTQFTLPYWIISDGTSSTSSSSPPSSSSKFVRVRTQFTFLSVLFDSSPKRLSIETSTDNIWGWLFSCICYLRGVGKKPFLVQAGGEGIFPHKEIVEFIGVVNMDRERYLVWYKGWRLITTFNGGSEQKKYNQRLR